MAATMATMNVVAVASPATVVKSSTFRGQRLNAGQQQGVRVAARRSVFVVRAEDKGVGKNIQDAGEQFSAAVQRGAESVKGNLQGTQADATSKAKKAAGSAEGDAESIGSKIANQAEDLKDQVFGAGSGAQKDAEKNLNKAQRAASSSGKDAQKEAGNVLDDVQKGLSDAADNVKDTFKGKN